MKKFLLLLAFCGVAHAEPNLIVCHARYALCAASPSTPTGRYMLINNITFQEAVSVCPVLTGKSVGDRNLIGSCKPPAGKDTVWSLFSAVTEYPQAPSWAVTTATIRTFVSTDAVGGGMANQWSYPCKVRPQKVNGATLADCLGPMNESPWNGAVVPVGSTIGTAAPIGAFNPVGGNFPPVLAK